MKLYHFAAAECQRLDVTSLASRKGHMETIVRRSHLPLQERINNLLSAGAFPRIATRAVNPASLRVARAETEFSGRLDHQIANLAPCRTCFVFQ
jgi:hypothetical protein